jgi:hypothetical protein
LPPRTIPDLRGATKRLRREAIIEGILVLDRLPVDRHDQIAGLQPARAAGLFSCTVATSAPPGA